MTKAAPLIGAVPLAGKPQPFKRTRARTCRIPYSRWKIGPKTWRKYFFNELRRSNNIARALDHARVSYEQFIEWRESGFITEQMLSDAERVFRLKHPMTDIIVTTPDEQRSTTTSTTTAHGYDMDTVLDKDGWSNPEYFDGW